MMSDERRYWIAFSVFPGIGPVRFKLLLDYFGSAKHAWEAPTQTLRDIHLGDALVSKFDHFRKTFLLDEYLRTLQYHHVNTLSYDDPKYPKLLREISDAPFVLYVKSTPGGEKIDMTKTVAIVGTRKATPYGIAMTRRLVSGLVSYGCTIVSGMAYGIDAVAHETAMNEGGKTIAVLGCGVDIIAPPSNAHIYRKLTEEGCGAVISEMPLGLRPGKGLFPARNRIISGLSRGVVVVEGLEDSGALITARNALDQGREVCAVPGSLTNPYSKAPLKLLKDGATLVESAEDVIACLGIAKAKKLTHNREIPRIFDTKEEEMLMSFLEKGPMHIDELVRMTHLQMPVVSATLTVLEMKGTVKDTGEKVYELIVN